METISLIVGITVLLGVSSIFFWRYVWFFRNPPRIVPPGENIVSPADGTVVYVKAIEPGEEVLVIKQGVAARLKDIVREDMRAPKILIGIFMSPFNVHSNRSPKTANVDMGSMHLRTIFNRLPLYENSFHIVENERTVTWIRGKFGDREMSCYVVQIAGKSVRGIDSYISEGGRVAKAEVFGLIRIGSQVDLVIPRLPGLEIKVSPGDRVLAGETILAE